ncbi:MAG: hypothetical protein K6F96_08905 [Bacteroidales bacterium]|nr:hypothetical protein [Bacteroidales bacterium]
MKRRILYLALLFTVALSGCGKYPVNPYYPNAVIDFSIYPNSIHEFELNSVSGYKYYTSDPMSTSRGIIVFRKSLDEFVAYDRLPPNYPYACCDDDGNCTRLVVENGIFVVDHCNNAYYNILNGEILIDASHGMVPTFNTDTTVFPLIQYQTAYDGSELRIYN